MARIHGVFLAGAAAALSLFSAGCAEGLYAVAGGVYSLAPPRHETKAHACRFVQDGKRVAYISDRYWAKDSFGHDGYTVSGESVYLEWFDVERPGDIHRLKLDVPTEFGSAGERGTYVDYAMSPDGQYALYWYWDSKSSKEQVKLVGLRTGTHWEIAPPGQRASFHMWHKGRIQYALCGDDGCHVLQILQRSIGPNGPGPAEPLVTVDLPAGRCRADFSPDGRYLLLEEDDPTDPDHSTPTIVDLETGARTVIPWRGAGPWKAWKPDSSGLLLTGDDAALLVRLPQAQVSDLTGQFKRSFGNIPRLFKGSSSDVWSSDGRFLLACSYNVDPDQSDRYRLIRLEPWSVVDLGPILRRHFPAAKTIYVDHLVAEYLEVRPYSAASTQAINDPCDYAMSYSGDHVVPLDASVSRCARPDGLMAQETSAGRVELRRLHLPASKEDGQRR